MPVVACYVPPERALDAGGMHALATLSLFTGLQRRRCALPSRTSANWSIHGRGFVFHAQGRLDEGSINHVARKLGWDVTCSSREPFVTVQCIVHV